MLDYVSMRGSSIQGDSRVDEDLRQVLRFSFFLHFFICCVSQRTLYDQFRKVMQAYRYFFFFIFISRVLDTLLQQGSALIFLI